MEKERLKFIMCIGGFDMSIMSQLLESKFIFFIFILLGLFAAPLLFLIPAAIFLLCWKAITDFVSPSFQGTLHFLLAYGVFVALLVWSGLYSKLNKWFIKKYWIHTRWYVPSDYE